jgi:hypothetical protein
MSKNKQSSIEWLAQQLYEQMEMCGDGGVYDKIIKQAKVLHEQEICQTYIDAIKEYMIDPLGDTLYRIDAEEYYNETFGDINNGEITMMGGDNNIPDTNTNTSTTGNLSGNIWGGDRTSTTENISGTWGGHTMGTTIGNTSAIWGGDTSNNKLYDSNTWRSWQKSIDENNRIAEEKKIWDGTTMAEYINKIEAEKQIWDKTVNWDIMNKHTRVNDEEQAPYNVKTNVVTSGKTNDGTLAVIEITVKVKQP